MGYHLRMLSLVASQAQEFDVIHNHADYPLLPLVRMTRTPVLTTLHGRIDLEDFRVGIEAFGEAPLISISDSQRKGFERLHWQKTIPHGLEPGDFDFQPRSGDYLAFLGRIAPDKGPERAIAIAKKAGIPLKIAAKVEGGSSQEFFDHAIRPHIDGRSVEFLGEIGDSEKNAFLGGALALCFPIQWPEPFGLVMIEALACGTPVLAHPRGSVPEVLRHGETGFIAEGVDELARLARELPALSRRTCRDRFEERFSLGRMTEDYCDVYRSFAEARGGGGKAVRKGQ
jgi:glycosyltransferase involved in cell wall biosynthesis